MEVLEGADERVITEYHNAGEQSSSNLVHCQHGSFESCVDLSRSMDEFEEFEIVKSHELEEWNRTTNDDGSTGCSSASDFLALTMSSVAESLWASFKLSDTDFEVIEMECCDPEVPSPSTSSTGNLGSAILDRALREREQELAELQHASCVTTGGARSNLSQFFNRYNQANSTDAPSDLQPISRDVNSPLPTDVQSLMRRNIVTSTLNGGSFRDLLERTLGARSVTGPPSSHQALNRSSNTGRPRFPRSRNTEGHQQSRPNLHASLLAEIRNLQPQQPSSLPANLNTDITARSSSAITNPEERSGAGRDQSTSSGQVSTLQQEIQRGVALLSDTINQDLRQLHQYSVVTSVLNSHFRRELEALAQRHADRVGNGLAVRDIIRSLGVEHSSNTAGRSSRLLDDELFTELRSLKVQMNEMRRIMQMNVEVQLDVQRAVRQEVSAIFGVVRQHIVDHLNSAMKDQKGSNAGSSLPASLSDASNNAGRSHLTVDAGACAICLDRRVDAVLYQCGHMCVCTHCALQLKADGHSCPVCRAPIQDVIRAYQSQMDM